MGVHITLDDFGTKYSSFSLIRQLPFTRNKIDRSFIQDIANNNQSATIVSAICLICSGLSVRSTAEGVETAKQMRRLIAEGCTDLQGYLISKPYRRPCRALVTIFAEVGLSAWRRVYLIISIDLSSNACFCGLPQAFSKSIARVWQQPHSWMPNPTVIRRSMLRSKILVEGLLV
ncbi:EAL domain-containing protein [Roseomonas aerophila]|uniref:EAL domain-containing protein n=1 Tax=Teichococcus aerophilus TaxID=1224513 RepID=A0ABR7RVB2_9PROT|nr:EAL domain-containing protein [Pseudoroseomonas aerophila]